MAKPLPTTTPNYLIANLLWVMLWFMLPFAALAQSDDAIPPKPDPAVYVHDYSGWLSAGEKQQLEYKLRRYWDATSTQIVVMIRPDIGDYDRATYAFDLGNKWGIGDKKKNNGVVMLIKTEQPDRGVFIATGYGAEGGLTDLQSGRIIRNTMGPFFREQRYYEGINAGTGEVMAALSGEFVRDPNESSTSDAWVIGIIILALLLGLLINYWFFKNFVKRARWYDGRSPHDDPYPDHSRGRRGGGGGWIIGSGGGWSGGGGGWSSGGGSFGGGSFGGGGAGGDW
jgi:uncharacterized protein